MVAAAPAPAVVAAFSSYRSVRKLRSSPMKRLPPVLTRMLRQVLFFVVAPQAPMKMLLQVLVEGRGQLLIRTRENGSSSGAGSLIFFRNRPPSYGVPFLRIPL